MEVKQKTKEEKEGIERERVGRKKDAKKEEEEGKGKRAVGRFQERSLSVNKPKPHTCHSWMLDSSTHPNRALCNSTTSLEKRTETSFTLA